MAYASNLTHSAAWQTADTPIVPCVLLRLLSFPMCRGCSRAAQNLSSAEAGTQGAEAGGCCSGRGGGAAAAAGGAAVPAAVTIAVTAAVTVSVTGNGVAVTTHAQLALARCDRSLSSLCTCVSWGAVCCCCALRVVRACGVSGSDDMSAHEAVSTTLVLRVLRVCVFIMRSGMGRKGRCINVALSWQL